MNSLDVFEKRLALAVLIIVMFSMIHFPVQAQTTLPLTITEVLPSERPDLFQENQPLQLGEASIIRVALMDENIEKIAASLQESPGVIVPAEFAVAEGLTVIARFSKIEKTLEGGFLLAGDIEKHAESTATLISTNGVVNAILTIENQQYQLSQKKDGDYQFSVIDQSLFPQESQPLIPPTIFEADPAPMVDDPVIQADSGGQIDVMVVYTDDARVAAGGTTNMVNLINLAVAESNQGFERSGVINRYRLVHTTEVAYDEFNGGTSLNWSVALNNITYSDGSLDQVLTLRNTYAADLVVMIVNDQTYCGMGWLMTSQYFASYAFSLVSRVCATGYYSFAHETGHNMGAHHDRVTSPENGMYPYSHGYWGQDYAFRTIMAYNCPVYCLRINNWSNPEIRYNGLPTGVISSDPNSADNRLTLNNTSGIVSNFRQSVVPPNPPSNLILSSRNMDSIAMQFTDNSREELGFKVEHSLNGGTWTQIATLPINQTTFTENNLLCNQPISYRVKAYSAAGDSDYSNTLATSTTACAPPDAPTSFQIVPATTSVWLNWQDVQSETAYLVESFQGTPESWILLKTLPANSTDVQITALLPATSYILRIGVENAYGVDYSDPILFTTMSTSLFFPLVEK